MIASFLCTTAGISGGTRPKPELKPGKELLFTVTVTRGIAVAIRTLVCWPVQTSDMMGTGILVNSETRKSETVASRISGMVAN